MSIILSGIVKDQVIKRRIPCYRGKKHRFHDFWVPAVERVGRQQVRDHACRIGSRHFRSIIKWLICIRIINKRIEDALAESELGDVKTGVLIISHGSRLNYNKEFF